MYEYNTSRKPLVLRAYGRNIQKTVAHISTIEDSALRTQYAHAILKLMEVLSPCARQVVEYPQKRWSDLFIIADYQLDVASTYPMPTSDLLMKKPRPLAYKKQSIRYRHYGRHIELLIQKATEITDLAEQERVVISIAKLIKSFSTIWNKDNLDNKTILAVIKELAGDKLAVDLEKIKAAHTFQYTAKEKDKVNKRGRGAFTAKTKQGQ